MAAVVGGHHGSRAKGSVRARRLLGGAINPRVLDGASVDLRMMAAEGRSRSARWLPRLPCRAL